MIQAIAKYLEYLQSVKNSSPHTVLTIAGTSNISRVSLAARSPAARTHRSYALDDFANSSHICTIMALRKLYCAKAAALRSFFKYCVAKVIWKENPHVLVPTPKLPEAHPFGAFRRRNERFPQSAGRGGARGSGGRIPKNLLARASSRISGCKQVRSMPRREKACSFGADRALLELLYAAGLRVQRNSPASIFPTWSKRNAFPRPGQRQKERIVPYGAKPRKPWKNTGPVREQLLGKPTEPAAGETARRAIFLHYQGGG